MVAHQTAYPISPGDSTGCVAVRHDAYFVGSAYQPSHKARSAGAADGAGGVAAGDRAVTDANQTAGVQGSTDCTGRVTTADGAQITSDQATRPAGAGRVTDRAGGIAGSNGPLRLITNQPSRQARASHGAGGVAAGDGA